MALNDNPTLTNGLFGQALEFNGKSQYASMDSSIIPCFADIENCQSGFTLRTWLLFDHIEDNTYIFSNAGDGSTYVGISIFYNNGQLHFLVGRSTRIWTLNAVYTPVLGKWREYVFSWSPMLGSEMLVNGKLLGTAQGMDRNHPVFLAYPIFFIGYFGDGKPAYVQMKIDNFKIWPTFITGLSAIGIQGVLL